MSCLWLSIEPHPREVRLSMSRSATGLVLRARFPLEPSQPSALSAFLEALVAWFGMPLCAVLDADAADVRRRPEYWARFLGDLDSPQVTVEWVTIPIPLKSRDRFLGELGPARRAKRLLSFAAVGRR